MKRHSLFFQGNDVELGILGDEMGYRVGHLAFDAHAVPDRFVPWFLSEGGVVGG